MNASAEVIERQIRLLTEQAHAFRQAAVPLLAAARRVEANDRAAAEKLLSAIETIAGLEKSAHGVQVQLLAESSRVRAAHGGMKAWLATHAGYSNGRAGALVRDARRIGAMPELTERLTAGEFGPDATRTLARTMKAVAASPLDPKKVLAETIGSLHKDGVTVANARVRNLEQKADPHRAEREHLRQRARSFARIIEAPGGMLRFDILLDPIRGAILRKAIEITTAYLLRRVNEDKVREFPEDVQSAEQINAEVFTRMAEVYLAATPEQRRGRFSPSALLFGKLRQATAT
jgi:hypothetical protein